MNEPIIKFSELTEKQMLHILLRLSLNNHVMVNALAEEVIRLNGDPEQVAEIINQASEESARQYAEIIVTASEDSVTDAIDALLKPSR